MKNKILLVFGFANLGAGLWNLRTAIQQTTFAGELFMFGLTVFSLLISTVVFGTLIATNHWKISAWLWNLIVTEFMAVLGVGLSIYFWFTGASHPDALIEQARNIPPHSIIFSGAAVVLSIFAIWYAVIEINVRKKALNTQMLPVVSEEEKK